MRKNKHPLKFINKIRQKDGSVLISYNVIKKPIVELNLDFTKNDINTK